MASKAMVEAASKVVESGGNIGDAIDAAIRVQVENGEVNKLYTDMGRTFTFAEDLAALREFFEVKL